MPRDRAREMRTRTKHVSFFTLGDWTVRPALGFIERQGERTHVEPKLLDVLACLAENPGDVVSVETLLERCWAGTFYGDNPVHKAIALLRKALGDDARSPRYLATVRKRGYRLVAPVTLGGVALPEAPGAQPWRGGSPYPGLRALEVGDAPVFVGRSGATERMLRLLAQARTAGHSFVLVDGPSGSGKSSLVHAGVLPVLLREGGRRGLQALDWATLDASGPVSKLRHRLVDAISRWQAGGEPLFPPAERRKVRRMLVRDPEEITRRIAWRAGDVEDDVFVLVIDNLETLVASGIRRPVAMTLFQTIARLAARGRVVVIGISRSEGRRCLIECAGQVGLPDAAMTLHAPREWELAQMIRVPAEVAGLPLAQEPATGWRLDDELIGELRRHPWPLPVLQLTLATLAAHPGAVHALDFPAYRALGGVDGIVSRYAEQVVSSLAKPEQATFLRLLKHLATVAVDDGAAQPVHARWASLDGDERRLAVRLVEARLLVRFETEEGHCVGMVHPPLLSSWPRCAEWIEAHHDFLCTRARLVVFAERWYRGGRRDEDLLPHGPLLDDAVALCASESSLTRKQRHFVRRSRLRARARGNVLACMSATILALTTCVMASMGDVGRSQGQGAKRQTSSVQDSGVSPVVIDSEPTSPAPPPYAETHGGFADWNVPHDLPRYAPYRGARRSATPLPPRFHRAEAGGQRLHGPHGYALTRTSGGATVMRW